MEPDDLLCSRNARSRTPLARAHGTSRRASGWAGENVARTMEKRQAALPIQKEENERSIGGQPHIGMD
jgi:hypothetical protein